MATFVYAKFVIGSPRCDSILGNTPWFERMLIHAYTGRGSWPTAAGREREKRLARTSRSDLGDEEGERQGDHGVGDGDQHGHDHRRKMMVPYTDWVKICEKLDQSLIAMLRSAS